MINKGAIPPGTASRFEVAKLRFALAQGDLGAILYLKEGLVKVYIEEKY